MAHKSRTGSQKASVRMRRSAKKYVTNHGKAERKQMPSTNRPSTVAAIGAFLRRAGSKIGKATAPKKRARKRPSTHAMKGKRGR
jgi:hypothetical protein